MLQNHGDRVLCACLSPVFGGDASPRMGAGQDVRREVASALQPCALIFVGSDIRRSGMCAIAPGRVLGGHSECPPRPIYT